MKINFGKYKHIELIVGNNSKMRPTKGMSKKIIFSYIKITEKDLVLDMFAGTGSLGFEAMSLGAKKVIWLDNDINSYRAIKSNISKFNLSKENYKVFHTDFRMGLKKLPFKPTLIFFDPPFVAEKYYDLGLKIISDNELLVKNGLIILQKPASYHLKNLKMYNIENVKKNGSEEIYFLRNKN